MQKVVDATTPLSAILYTQQAAKKNKEARYLTEQLAAEILGGNKDATAWLEFQVSKSGFCWIGCRLSAAQVNAVTFFFPGEKVRILLPSGQVEGVASYGRISQQVRVRDRS